MFSLKCGIYMNFLRISLKLYKKPGKIYCSTFRGHRDSIIKRLVKSYANKEKYKISTEITINGLNKHLGTDGICLQGCH